MSQQPFYILLIEDNDVDTQLTLRALKQSGVTIPVEVVKDGAEAVDFLFGTGRHAQRDTSHIPVIIILDLKLPKLNGLEILQRIKANPQTEQIPVIVFTSTAQEGEVAESYRLGASTYIVKPVDYGEYCQAIQSIVEQWLSSSRA